ncbi:7067_t:CDS:1, partial [Funneliformis geosporum]
AQLITMYQRLGFESLLKKWTNWNDTELITDIYDREIWKTFPSQIDIPDSS